MCCNFSPKIMLVNASTRGQQRDTLKQSSPVVAARAQRKEGKAVLFFGVLGTRRSQPALHTVKEWVAGA